MPGDIEIDKCGTCKQVKPVSRKYFFYDIKCECCNNNHFVIVKHCSDCEPVEPTHTKVEIKTSNLKRIQI